MNGNTTPKTPTRAVIEYENVDVRPAYVEGAQGMRTPQGALHVSFYSEYVKARDKLNSQVTSNSKPGENSVTIAIASGDPFGIDDDEIRIVRRIEASLILTVPALQTIVPWLQQKLNELTQNDSSDAAN